MFNGINSLFYPMTADIYYATQSQNDFGEIQRSWEFDRTIKCSAIRPTLRNANFVEIQPNIEYDILINFRTSEDIQTSKNLNVYKVTDIIIKNIKDTSGTVVWKEDTSNSTVFEIRSIEPLLDISSKIMGYKAVCMRSDNQVL